MMERELLNEREVASRYGLSVPWLRRARRERRGPHFVKVSRMVRYRLGDIEAFLQERTVETHER
jgi:predicted DNA-binding transcriptional regulator AlpA